MDHAERATSGAGRRVAGAFAGLLSGLVVLGVAEAVAALLRRTSSPVIAVGGAFVDRTPRWLKEYAIRQFGENDKNVLIAGIVATVLVIAAVVGALAVRRPLLGTVAVAALGVVASVAAVTRPNAGVVDALPSALGALAGLLVLAALLHTLRRPVTAGTQHPDGLVERLRDSLSMTDRKGSLDRRSFLLTSVGAGAVAAAGGAGGRAVLGRRLDVSDSRAAVTLRTPTSPAPALPAGAELDVPGISSFYTRARDFYRVDTALAIPQVSTDGWKLRVHGMVEREVTLDWDALNARPMIERDITLTCVSNEVGGRLMGTARWLGVPLRPLLEQAGVRRGADQIVSRSVDGMTIGTPTSVAMDGRDAMIAIAMNGEPLLPVHGFPARMLVPGLYGYVSATKWVIDLELTTFDAFDPYWVKRGWKQRAPIKTGARIDTPRPLANRKPGTVAVAGVAWAQHRGIGRVEVRVDGGPWHEARLSTAASKDLWRQWVWEWDAAGAGPHTLQARATDIAGRTQPEARVPIFPDGATGWHSVVVTVDG